MQDRLVLIEVENFKGVISMNDDGVLHQTDNPAIGTTTPVNASKDTMHLTGIR